MLCIFVSGAQIANKRNENKSFFLSTYVCYKKRNTYREKEMDGSLMFLQSPAKKTQLQQINAFVATCWQNAKNYNILAKLLFGRGIPGPSLKVARRQPQSSLCFESHCEVVLQITFTEPLWQQIWERHMLPSQLVAICLSDNCQMERGIWNQGSNTK